MFPGSQISYCIIFLKLSHTCTIWAAYHHLSQESTIFHGLGSFSENSSNYIENSWNSSNFIKNSSRPTRPSTEVASFQNDEIHRKFINLHREFIKFPSGAGKFIKCPGGIRNFHQIHHIHQSSWSKFTKFIKFLGGTGQLIKFHQIHQIPLKIH